MTRQLYVLLDPRETGYRSVRYVGITDRPETRLERHTGDPTPGSKRRWILELRRVGLRPELILLGKGTGKDEARLIHSLRDVCELTNSRGGDLSWDDYRPPSALETATRDLVAKLAPPFNS